MSAPSDDPSYLDTYLAPLRIFLARNDVTDIYINGPGEIWLETITGFSEQHDEPGLTEAKLLRLAHQIAAFAHQGVNREHPLLGATLPDGARVQIVLPPATRATTAIAIRKHVSSKLKLSDYAASGAFSDTITGPQTGHLDVDRAIIAARDGGDLAKMLSLAVKARKTILISGGTSTGKTTFLNALMDEIPDDERLILIEDTPELLLRHSNAVGLLAARGELGEARVTTNDLLTASLRMRPDRIIVGELRGPEAFTFLRAINTGHPGSMSTVHADSPAHAIEQIALLVLQSGAPLRRADVIDYVKSTVDVYIQLARQNGRRRVAAVRLRGEI